MTQARNHHAFLYEPTFYHTTTRCVRRSWLCGIDKLTGNNYNHRKRWLEKRLFALMELFFIDLYGYAILENHYHLVIRTRPDAMAEASDEAIAERWCRLFPRRDEVAAERVTEICQVSESIAKYRERLCDISWLMRCLNEPLARLSNREDGCKGRFWEGRFHSQMLADEAAVYTCMAYVDLNPVRAGKVAKPEESEYTSLVWRLRRQKLEETLIPLVMPRPVNEKVQAESPLSMNLKDYVLPVEESGRAIRDDKRGFIHDQALSILERIGLNSRGYVQAVSRFSQIFFRVIGHKDKMEAIAGRLKQNWLAGQAACRSLYRE